VRGVNISDLNTSTLTAEATGAQCRKTTLVSQTRKRVVLVHELRELAGAKELFDCSNNGTDVDQGLGRDGLNVLRRHALTNHTLHARKSGADLVLNQFTHGAYTTVTEVVDVVDIDTDVDLLARAGALHVCATIVKRHQVLDGGDDVLNRKNRVLQRLLETQLAVDLVTTDLCQVITLGVEVEVIQQQTCCFSSYLLAWTQLAVDVLEGFFLGEDGVLFQGVQNRRKSCEVLRNVFGSQSQRLEETVTDCLRLRSIRTPTGRAYRLDSSMLHGWESRGQSGFLVANCPASIE